MVEGSPGTHLTSRAHVVGDYVDPGTLPPEVLHHLFAVKRLKIGNLVTICDGNGTVQEAQVVKGDGSPTLSDKRKTKTAGLSLTAVGLPYKALDVRADLEIVMSVIDVSRIEQALARLTELGVRKITLVEARRSKSLGGALSSSKFSLDRLVRVIDEAASQSRALYRPLLSVEPFDSVLERVVVCDPFGDPIRVRPAAILIGPEGGFEPGELPLSVQRIRLPGNILRADTAAVVSAAIALNM